MQAGLLTDWIGTRKGLIAGAVMFLLCLLYFGYSGNTIALLLPFGACFALLLLTSWRTVWWLLLVGMIIAYDVEISSSLATSLPDEPLMAVFLVVTLLLIGARRQLFNADYLRNPLMLIIGLQYIWLFVAVIYSLEPLISVKFFIAKNWMLASFFLMPLLIFREKADFRKAFRLLFIPLLVIVTYIFAIHAIQYRFGFREIEHAIPDIFYNHVDYGAILSMMFPPIVAAFVLTKKGFMTRTFLLGVILFWLAAIYFSYARGAVLAILFAGVIVMAIRFRLVNLIMPAFYTLVVVAIFWLSHNSRYLDFYPDYDRTYSHATFSDHMIATFKGQDMSSAERFYRWIAGVRMSQDRPLTGVGPNAFYEYYKPYAVTNFQTWVSRNPERSTTHNYFLFMLVEQGWPAMILYAILVVLYFAQVQKVYHRFRDPYWRVVTLALAGVFAASFINNFFSELLETHKVGAFFYLSISLLLVLNAKSKQLQRKALPA
ncbi:MAG: O-antigen ligase family protein [Sphingobacteriales bacterium]|nr:MAG: O-antigen ligase family protein [Sphingobacteriales bacterium]